ncbi:MAG: hypothetical protein WDN45_02505 [Caulobacteraceae bacterium]
MRAALVMDLAKAGGHDGMIGGQMMDIEAPNHSFGAKEVIELQARKTGALFEFSARPGRAWRRPRPRISPTCTPTPATWAWPSRSPTT